MSDKRQYRSPLREKRARETRLAILDAALERFFEHGYAATSVRSIADGAGVSAQTVYNAFGDKPGLLRAAADRWFSGSDEPVDLADSPVGAQLRSEPDLHERLRIASQFALEAYRRGDIRAVIDGAIAAEPDLSDLAAWAMDHSHRNTRALLELALGDAVPTGTARDDLIDLLWAVFNSEALRRLIDHRGWPIGKARDHLTRLVGSLVAEVAPR